ncbi:MAG: hypothetical protein HZB51_06325 [Chloroflexi bacterium]|nr:hypothetical protein [Chloroflexota bacterium]
MTTNHGRKDAAREKLQQILEEAAEGGADSIELEYAPEGLEISTLVGSTGIGNVLDDRMLAREIIGLIIDRAKLENKSRGVMNWILVGKPRNIIVEEYDSFGESAFRLILGKPRRKHR